MRPRVQLYVFSPDGHPLAVAGPGLATTRKADLHKLQLWDTRSGKVKTILLEAAHLEVSTGAKEYRRRCTVSGAQTEVAHCSRH